MIFLQKKLSKTPNKSLTDKAIHGFMWLFASSGVQSISQLVVTSILARLLSPSDFGVVAAAMVVVFFAEFLYEMGVGPAIVQKEKIEPIHINVSYTFSVLSGVFLAVIFYLYLNRYIALFFEFESLESILDALIWIFPLRTISQISYSLLQRELQFRSIAGSDAISYIIGFGLVGVSLAYLDFGVWSLVWANIVQAVIYSLFLMTVKPHSIKFAFNWKALKELLTYGTGFTISQIFNFIARKADYVIIGKLLGAASLGIYSKAYALMNGPNNLIGKVITTILFSIFSRKQDKAHLFADSFRKIYSILFIACLPTSFLLFLLSPEIIYLLLGSQWTDAILPFQILTLGMTLRIAYKIGGSFSKSIGKVYSNALVQVVYSILIALASLLGAKWGIEGVCVGITLALFINLLMHVGVSIRYTNFTWLAFITSWIPGCVLTLLVGPIVFFVTYLRTVTDSKLIVLCGTLLLFSIILVTLYFLLPRRYTDEHLGWLFKKIKNLKR